MKDFIPFRNQKEICIIPFSDVIYIIQDKRKVKIVTKDKEYIEYGKVSEIKENLDDRFYSCLKNTVINMEKVRGLINQNVIFQDNITLHIGRDSFNRTKKEFINYIKKM